MDAATEPPGGEDGLWSRMAGTRAELLELRNEVSHGLTGLGRQVGELTRQAEEHLEPARHEVLGKLDALRRARAARGRTAGRPPAAPRCAPPRGAGPGRTGGGPRPHRGPRRGSAGAETGRRHHGGYSAAFMSLA